MMRIIYIQMNEQIVLAIEQKRSRTKS